MLSGRVTNVACMLVLMVGLAGCRQSQPSASEGEKVLSEKVAGESEGRIKLVNFAKTDGQASEVAGVKVYTLEYSGEIEFQEECRWISEPFSTTHNGFRTARVQPADPNNPMALFNALNAGPGEAVKKGERRHISGQIVFRKTENGWRGA